MQSDDNDNKSYDDDYVIESLTSCSNVLSSCTSVSDDDESETRPTENINDECDESSPIYIPNDPTTWLEKHIETWIKWATKQFQIKPEPDPARFPKTGDELTKFTKADWWMTCGSIEGGKSLVQHFKYLMETIGKSVEESLKNEADPGEIKILILLN